MRLRLEGGNIELGPRQPANDERFLLSTPIYACNTSLQTINEHQAIGALQESHKGSLSYFTARKPKMWQDDEDNNPYGSFNNQDPANPALSASCEEFALLGANLY